jgi:hypothetical protein
MRIVLPGALPDPPEARELAAHLQRNAPTLAHWFSRARAHSQLADPANTGCTPYEYWQLEQYGFQPEPGRNFATGLGPLYAGSKAQAAEPVWLAELVHVSPSRDGAALLPANELNISPQHSVALLESVQDMARESGFSFTQVNTVHWQVKLPEDCYLAAVASPTIVSLTSVNDWWQQDMTSRPWRRLVNEIQMLWFDHVVNQQRYEQQQVPVNSLWLFGGARPFTALAQDANGNDTLVVSDLHDAAKRHDWGLWLQQLSDLEARVFKQHQQTPTLVLTGNQRIVTLEPRTGLLARLTLKKTDWRSWWSPQN